MSNFFLKLSKNSFAPGYFACGVQSVADMTYSEASPAFWRNSGSVKPAAPPMNACGLMSSSLLCRMSIEASIRYDTM